VHEDEDVDFEGNKGLFIAKKEMSLLILVNSPDNL